MVKGVNINLLPSDVRKKRKAEKGWIILVVAILIFGGLLLSASFFFGLKVSQEEDNLKNLEAKTKIIEKQISDYNVFKERKEEISKHEEAIKKALDKQLFWHRFLNELSMVIPQEISVSKITLANDQVSISGAAWNHQDVAEFLVRMSDLDELKDVWIDGSKDADLEKATIVGESDSGGSSSGESKIKAVEFTLTAKLKNPGPAASTESSSSQDKPKDSGS